MLVPWQIGGLLLLLLTPPNHIRHETDPMSYTKHRGRLFPVMVWRNQRNPNSPSDQHPMNFGQQRSYSNSAISNIRLEATPMQSATQHNTFCNIVYTK